MMGLHSERELKETDTKRVRGDDEVERTLISGVTAKKPDLFCPPLWLSLMFQWNCMAKPPFV
jgi:hypothetical protein